MYSKVISIFVFFMLIFFSCEQVNESWQKDAVDPKILHQSVSDLTDVIVHDIFSPPVASRNYAYPAIAAYEVARHLDPAYKSLVGQVNELEQLPLPDKTQEYCFPLAASYTHLSVAKNFVFSETMMETKLEEVLQFYKKIRMPGAVFDRSIAFGEAMKDAIIAYAKKDNYAESRSFPRFTISENPVEWKPTPPAYMEAIEPHWGRIRPFVIDSAQQFVPEVPTNVTLEKNSDFYRELMEVYDAVKNADAEEKEIASFWDCNPYVMNVAGHVMHATKKITPGGHWMGIAGIACKKAEADYLQSCETYVMVSLVLADGFISCWDEKYRSNIIRPETLINEHIDAEWMPLLQTPPFPEYTSGHSVISTAAAVALTHLYGENFSFRDDTELQYGLPVRAFGSFYEASAEAAISRLYGGIHYRPAIEHGVKQGRALGVFVVGEIETKL